MNTALHASPPTESTHRAQDERELSLRLPREEELRRLTFAERLALRIALRLVLRARSDDRAEARAARAELARRILAEHEAQLIRYGTTRPIL